MIAETRYSKLTSLKIYKPQALFELKTASNFTVQALTDIYNQTREDYIVPMPMNRAKMQEYITCYDVDLTQSVVVMADDRPLGLAMLGVRGDQTWITRLGVTPAGRQKGVGRGLMDGLLENSRRLGSNRVILEVIKNNTPAQQLFESYGFQTTRELLVIRRPPAPTNMLAGHTLYIEVVGHQEALNLLKQRTDTPSWVTANQSLAHVANLSALVADIPGIGRGWLVYQSSLFQVTRLVLELAVGASIDVAASLLQHLHWRHSVQDTAVENLPIQNEMWPVFKRLGYLISFTRIEMVLEL